MPEKTLLPGLAAEAVMPLPLAGCGPGALVALAVLLAALMLAPLPLRAAPNAASDAVAGVVEDVAEQLADIDSSPRAPRMALVRVGSSAMIADAYAGDAGWPDADRAILRGLGAAREADGDGWLLSNDETPAFLFTQAEALTERLARACPDTEVASLAGLEPAEGDNL